MLPKGISFPTRGVKSRMAFVDNPLYRRDGFGVRCGIKIVALATFPWIANITSVAAQGVYREVPVADGAELVGTAVFRGDIPDPRRLLVTKDEEVCGFGYLERNEVAVGEEGGGLLASSLWWRAFKRGRSGPICPTDMSSIRKTASSCRTSRWFRRRLT